MNAAIAAIGFKMTSDKKNEGFDEAAASSVGADMACKYASDFVFNASGVYYIQVNSFVDGARWQWQQAQSKIRELEIERLGLVNQANLAIRMQQDEISKLAAESSDLTKSLVAMETLARDKTRELEQLQRRVAELENDNKDLRELNGHWAQEKRREFAKLEAELKKKSFEICQWETRCVSLRNQLEALKGD